jgi:hypothetical protein
MKAVRIYTVVKEDGEVSATGLPFRKGQRVEVIILAEESFAHRDAPTLVPTTAGILVGLWAWLNDVPPQSVNGQYPSVSVVAQLTRECLGVVTPVKRWLAGRLSIGIRIWLQGGADHGDIPAPRPGLEPYPMLSKD